MITYRLRKSNTHQTLTSPPLDFNDLARKHGDMGKDAVKSQLQPTIDKVLRENAKEREAAAQEKSRGRKGVVEDVTYLFLAVAIIGLGVCRGFLLMSGITAIVNLTQ